MEVNKLMGDAECPDDAPTAAPNAEPSEASRQASALDPRRVDEIRNRIFAGAYRTNEMAEQVARAILRSGDL